MNLELAQFKNCLQDKAFHPQDTKRVSLNPNIQDTDLIWENPTDPYLLDYNKLLNSKALKRLSNKTQVFFDPDNPHIRTRRSHTDEVLAISPIISDFLGLNTRLVMAQSLGHDLGHSPGGHLFEQVTESLGLPKFKHEEFSAIVAGFIERGGDGLNLTKETLKGFYEHSRGVGDFHHKNSSSQESLVTMFSDKIGYIFSDFNDLYRQRWFSPGDYKFINSFFPGNQRDRVNKCLTSLIKESADLGYVSFNQSQTALNFSKVKDLMYKYYYQLNRKSLAESIKTVYGALDDVPQLIKYDKTMLIALMTDRELAKIDIISCNQRLNLDDLRTFGVFEIIELGFLEGQTYSDLNCRLKNIIYDNPVK